MDVNFELMKKILSDFKKLKDGPDRRWVISRMKWEHDNYPKPKKKKVQRE
jgi:hypothetical protein